MIVRAEKKGKKLQIEIPLNQYDLMPYNVARYIIALYEFSFVPDNTKCFISAEVENNRLKFSIKPNFGDELFERTYSTILYREPSAAFYNALVESGFEIIKKSQMSWEIIKK